MHARTAEVLRYLDEQAHALRDAFDAVPAPQRSRRPTADRWSPAEIVHHVAIVNRRMVQVITPLVERARALPPERETSSVVAGSPGLVGADRGTRRTASEASTPRDTDPSKVRGDFDASVDTLDRLLRGADGLALGAVTANHPVLGEINGYDWMVFAAAHIGRHAAQLRELG